MSTEGFSLAAQIKLKGYVARCGCSASDGGALNRAASLHGFHRSTGKEPLRSASLHQASTTLLWVSPYCMDPVISNQLRSTLQQGTIHGLAEKRILLQGRLICGQAEPRGVSGTRCILLVDPDNLERTKA